MYNDYRDVYPPGTLIKYTIKGADDIARTRYGIVCDIGEPIGRPVHSRYTYQKNPSGIWAYWSDTNPPEKNANSVGHISMFTEIEIVEPLVLVNLCSCPWNKHPLFCKCK